MVKICLLPFLSLFICMHLNVYLHKYYRNTKLSKHVSVCVKLYKYATELWRGHHWKIFLWHFNCVILSIICDTLWVHCSLQLLWISFKLCIILENLKTKISELDIKFRTHYGSIYTELLFLAPFSCQQTYGDIYTGFTISVSYLSVCL